MKHLRKHSSVISVLAVFVLCMPTVAFAETNFLEEALWDIVVGVFGMFAGLGGLLLNYGISEYVINFSKNAGVISAINLLWVAVRDLFNLTFIFGLVYIGFKMILDSDNARTRHTLVTLIMAALLVNFSLFITKFVVDFSNILATEIATNGFQVDQNTGKLAVSDTFMNNMGVNSLLGAQDLDKLIAGDKSASGYIFGTMITLIVMAFVFAAGGFLLLIRYVALCLYMILSPLMFIGWIFPGLQSYTRRYWKGFLGRAFFAPVYLLLLYFAAYILTSLYTAQSTQTGGPEFNKMFAGTGNEVLSGFGGTITPFILSCIFLIAALTIAQKMGADGASAAMSIGNKARNRTQQYIQRKAMNTAKGAALGASYPLRAPTRLAVHSLGKKYERGINAAQARGGALGWVAKRNFIDTGARNQAEKLKNAKFGMSQTYREDRLQSEATKGRADRHRDRRAAVAEYQEANKRANNEKLSRKERKQADRDRHNANNKLKGIVGKMTNEEILALNKHELEAISGHLSPDQFKAIKSSGAFRGYGAAEAGNEMKQLGSARDKALFSDALNSFKSVTSSTKELGDAISSLSKTMKGLPESRLHELDKSYLTNERVAMHLSEKQISSLQESGKYNTDEMDEIRTAREQGLLTIASGNYTNGKLIDSKNETLTSTDSAKKAEMEEFTKKQREELMNRSVKDLGELPVKIFVEQKMAPHLKPEALEQRIKNGGLSDADMKTIEENISKHLSSSHATPADKKKWQKWAEKSTVGMSFNTNAAPKPQNTETTISQDTNISRALNDRDNQA